MPEQIENKMVRDSAWESIEKYTKYEVHEEDKITGWKSMVTGKFVPDSEAYDYALECCLSGSEEDQQEFRDMLLEWFFSGNWIRSD